VNRTGAGIPNGMSLPRRARRAVPVLAAALALGAAGCGEDDVERSIDQGAKEAEEAGRDAEKAGKDAANKAEEAAKDAEREVEK
jgi:hypothetical protein